MHRRDIEVIAKAVKAKLTLGPDERTSHDYQSGHHDGVTDTAMAIAAYMKSEHPQFRVDLFYKACGLE